jgi:hypothetical protein
MHFPRLGVVRPARVSRGERQVSWNDTRADRRLFVVLSSEVRPVDEGRLAGRFHAAILAASSGKKDGAHLCAGRFASFCWQDFAQAGRMRERFELQAPEALDRNSPSVF